jgi:glucose/arabinose dehydrogenase
MCVNLRGIVLGSTLLFAASAVFYAQQKTLPPPFATPTVNNGPHVIRQPEGAKLSVPPGFQVEIYQEGFKVPRFMLLGPSHEVLLSDSARGTSGTVYVLQGKERKAIITGLDRPYGLALQDGCQCRDKTPAILPTLPICAAVNLGGDAVGTLQ